MDLRSKISHNIEAARRQREENSYDNEMQPHSPDRRDFAEHDGDAPGKHLSLKRKEAHSDDRMPSIDEAYSSTDSKVRSV